MTAEHYPEFRRMFEGKVREVVGIWNRNGTAILKAWELEMSGKRVKYQPWGKQIPAYFKKSWWARERAGRTRLVQGLAHALRSGKVRSFLTGLSL